MRVTLLSSPGLCKGILFFSLAGEVTVSLSSSSEVRLASSCHFFPVVADRGRNASWLCPRCRTSVLPMSCPAAFYLSREDLSLLLDGAFGPLACEIFAEPLYLFLSEARSSLLWSRPLPSIERDLLS